jgi:hypothetical protein
MTTKECDAISRSFALLTYYSIITNLWFLTIYYMSYVVIFDPSFSYRTEEPVIPPLAAVTAFIPSPDVQVLDMPVDPNEPTYCLCHQVSVPIKYFFKYFLSSCYYIALLNATIQSWEKWIF